MKKVGFFGHSIDFPSELNRPTGSCLSLHLKQSKYSQRDFFVKSLDPSIFIVTS